MGYVCFPVATTTRIHIFPKKVKLGLEFDLLVGA